MYDIEIDYTTGDSFNSERVSGEAIGVVTSDLDKAKENLKRIKKHYAECQDNPNIDKKYALTLLADVGQITIVPFWIGYFETLHGAKIVAEKDTDMAFSLE